jgi:hypothetical protein
MRVGALMKHVALGAALVAVQTLALAELDSRNEAHLQKWTAEKKQESAVAAFQEFLQRQGVANVVPIHQLLRTASDWNLPVCKKVNAPPFEVPPKDKWARTVKALKLLALLREKQILPPFEVVSAYRNKKVETCAEGAGTRHPQAGAFDLLIPADQRRAVVKRLCTFYWREGSKYTMGFSQYSTGRLHIDTVRPGTWGDDKSIKTSACMRES